MRLDKDYLENVFHHMDEHGVLDHLIDYYNTSANDPTLAGKMVESKIQWDFAMDNDGNADKETLSFNIDLYYPQLDKKMALLKMLYTVVNDEDVKMAFKMFVDKFIRIIMFGAGPLEMGNLLWGRSDINWLHPRDDKYIPKDELEKLMNSKDYKP